MEVKSTVRNIASAVSRIPLVRPTLRPFSKAGLLPDPVWKRLPVDEVFDVRIETEYFRYASFDGDDLGRVLYWKGITAFEGETVVEFCSLVRSAKIVIDVGACTGFYSLLALASNPDTRVIAFEPVAANQQRVELNLLVNNWENRCILRPECVSDKCGHAKLHVPYSNGGAIVSSSSLNKNGFRGLPGETIDVQCTTLDAALAAETSVDLVKIDVEGFEGAVLSGMQRILSEQRPSIILECSEETTEDAEIILTRFGYELYHLTASGRVPVSHLVPDNTFRNYLAKPAT
jgi:FkbM family methyltransferase